MRRSINELETKINGTPVKTENLQNNEILVYNGEEFVNQTISGGGLVNTIYTADDTVTGNRTVTLGSNDLLFTGANSTNLFLQSNIGKVSVNGSDTFDVNCTQGLTVTGTGDIRGNAALILSNDCKLRREATGSALCDINTATGTYMDFRVGGFTVNELGLSIVRDASGNPEVKLPNIDDFPEPAPTHLITCNAAGDLKQSTIAELESQLTGEQTLYNADGTLNVDRVVTINNANRIEWRDGGHYFNMLDPSAGNFLVSGGASTSIVMSCGLGVALSSAEPNNGVNITGGGNGGQVRTRNLQTDVRHNTAISLDAPLVKLDQYGGGGSLNLTINNAGEVVAQSFGADTSIYQNDGNLLSNRVVDGQNLFSLTFQDMTTFAVNNPNFALNSSVAFDLTHSGTVPGQVRCDNTKLFLQQNDLVELNSAQIQLNGGPIRATSLSGSGLGLVRTDNNGELAFAQNVETSYVVNWGGNVTAAPPRYLCFSACGNGATTGAASDATKFTVPKPGFVYRVTWSVQTSGGSAQLVKNGTNQQLLTFSSNTGFSVLGTPIQVNAGDTLEVFYSIGTQPGRTNVCFFISA